MESGLTPEGSVLRYKCRRERVTRDVTKETAVAILEVRDSGEWQVVGEYRTQADAYAGRLLWRQSGVSLPMRVIECVRGR